MNAEFVRQYEHTWKMFERIVEAFDSDAWLHAGRGATTPVRIALHVLQGTKYYIEGSSITAFASGKSFDSNPESADEDELPSQKDVLVAIHDFKESTAKWLNELDFSAENTSFAWAGKTRLGVALFLLRHSVYHIGELSCLLNETKNGQVEDNWIAAL